MLKVILPISENVEQEIVSTSWYLFETSDTSDLSKALDKYVDDSTQKVSVIFGYPVEDNKPYYIYAVSKTQDGSLYEHEVIEANIEDFNTKVYNTPNVGVEMPIIRIKSNTLSETDGQLEIETSRIRERGNILYKTIYILYNTKREVVYYSVDTTNLTSKTILRSEITEYIAGEQLILEVAHMNNIGVMSNFAINIIPGRTVSVELVKPLSNLDPTSDYPILLTTSDYLIDEAILVDEYLSETVLSMTDTFIIGSRYLKFNRSYRLILKVRDANDDTTRYIIDFPFKTLSGREVYSYKPDYVYSRSIIQTDSVQYRPSAICSEELMKGVYIDIKDNKLNSIVRTGTGYNVFVTNFELLTQPISDIRVYTVTPTSFVIVYKNTDNNYQVEYYKHNYNVDSIERVHSITIPEIISAIYAYNTEDLYYIYKDANNSLKLSKVNILTGNQLDLVDIITTTSSNFNLNYIYGSKILITGDLDNITIFNIITSEIDYVKPMPDIFKNTSYVSETLINGSVLLVAKDGSGAVLYKHSTNEILSIALPNNFNVQSIYRDNDGSVIFFKDIKAIDAEFNADTTDTYIFS